MKLRALSACVAVLVFAVACATTAQQPETHPAVVPTPTREPLDGEEIPIIIGIAYIPNGIISEETEAYLGENVLIGNPAKIRYYNDDHGETREFIGVIQEVLLPEKAYVDETSSFGSIGRRFKWPPGFPLGFPPEMTGTNTLSMDVFRNGFPPGVSDAEMLMFNVFAFGNVYYITYKGERTVIAKGLGYFLVGEEQSSLFWFLFEQLGDDRALIISAESYEKWWGIKERKQWDERLTPPAPTVTSERPPTSPPLPPGTPAPETAQSLDRLHATIHF